MKLDAAVRSLFLTEFLKVWLEFEMHVLSPTQCWPLLAGRYGAT